MILRALFVSAMCFCFVVPQAADAACGSIVVIRNGLRQTNQSDDCVPGWKFNQLYDEVSVSENTVTFLGGCKNYVYGQHSTWAYRIYCTNPQNVIVTYNYQDYQQIIQKHICIEFRNPSGSDPVPINNLTVNLGAFKSSQIAVLSSITGNVSSISLSRGPGAPTNGGRCYLTVGGNINGAVNADAYNLYVTGSINGNLGCASALTGAIQAGGNISGNITINGTSNSTGSITATGNITGTVTIPNFTGNICAANLNVDNIFCMQPNILPTGVNGVFSGTWTVCGNPPSGMPCPGTSPSPAHQAIGVMITKRLSWTAGANTTAYKVYLGTDTSQSG